MRAKGCDGASTIHSLIYKARESGEEAPSFDLWDDAPASKAALIVIDECSMVDAELGRDLISFGVPLLVLGDPAQLAADPGRRLLHRGRARRHADRGAPAGAGRSDHPAVDGGARGRRARARPLRRDRDRAARRARSASACSTPIRSWSAATPRGAPTIRGCASGAAARKACRVADDKLVCLRNNRRKGLFNGGLWSVKERSRRRAPRSSSCGICPMPMIGRGARRQGHQGFGAARMLYRRHRGLRMAASARNTTSSITAMCSPCTRRRARNGTTWCCSTKASPFPTAAQRWLYTGITRAAKKLTLVVS